MKAIEILFLPFVLALIGGSLCTGQLFWFGVPMLFFSFMALIINLFNNAYDED